jgi:hypothetical protein
MTQPPAEGTPPRRRGDRGRSDQSGATPASSTGGALSRAARGGRDVPRRVRVTSPRSQARRRPPQRPLSSEIGEQTQLGEVYVTSHIRAQLRLSIVVTGGVGVAVGILPAFLILVPALSELRVGPVPLTWVLVGSMLYPFLLLVARSYTWAAERVERDFGDLLEAES